MMRTKNGKDIVTTILVEGGIRVLKLGAERRGDRVARVGQRKHSPRTPAAITGAERVHAGARKERAPARKQIGPRTMQRLLLWSESAESPCEHRASDQRLQIGPKPAEPDMVS